MISWLPCCSTLPLTSALHHPAQKHANSQALIPPSDLILWKFPKIKGWGGQKRRRRVTRRRRIWKKRRRRRRDTLCTYFYSSPKASAWGTTCCITYCPDSSSLMCISIYCMFIYMQIHLCAYLSVCICIYIGPSMCGSTYVHVHLHRSIYVHIYLCACPSICRSI